MTMENGRQIVYRVFGRSLFIELERELRLCADELGRIASSEIPAPSDARHALEGKGIRLATSEQANCGCCRLLSG